MSVVERGLPGRPRLIINFPAKKHWRNQSRLADIKSGLVDLRRVIGDRAVGAIAAMRKTPLCAR
jgi:hypothetical protein